VYWYLCDFVDFVGEFVGFCDFVGCLVLYYFGLVGVVGVYFVLGLW